MARAEGLRVIVEGDLDPELLDKVSLAVRVAVLGMLASLDDAPELFEWPLDLESADDDQGGIIGGWHGKLTQPEDPFGVPVPDPNILP